MGNLKTELDSLYNALLTGDGWITVETSYEAAIKALIGIYKKRGAVSL